MAGMDAVIYPDRFRGCRETLIPTLFGAVLFLFCVLFPFRIPIAVGAR